MYAADSRRSCERRGALFGRELRDVYADGADPAGGSKSNAVNPSESTAEASTRAEANSTILAEPLSPSIASRVPQRRALREPKLVSCNVYWYTVTLLMWLPPEILETRLAQRRVARGVRDRDVPEPVLNRPGVDAVIRQFVAAGMP
jgi:hypothetical protein